MDAGDLDDPSDVERSRVPTDLTETMPCTDVANNFSTLEAVGAKSSVELTFETCGIRS